MFRSLMIILVLAFLVHFPGCKVPYDPSLEAGVQDFLIVEGFINANGLTSVRLSKSIKLAETGFIKHENGAILQIEGDDNTVYPLMFKGNGLYQSDELTLSSDNIYRLRIKTAEGLEYLSDYSEVLNSPEVEVSWDQQDDGVRIYANTEDPSGQTKYYQWTYEEDWEVKSIRLSLFEVVSINPLVTIKERTLEDVQKVLTCWGHTNSTNILTFSTTALAEVKVSEFPLVFIPNGSDKLTVRYSILARQNAIPRDAYEFLELMKKNSEQMGSLFDPMPSNIKGNIHNVHNPEEPAVGYIYTANPSEKRIFIESAEAGNWQHSMMCLEKFVKRTDFFTLGELFREDMNSIADTLNQIEFNGSETKGWLIYPSPCLDCRLRGGTVKPDFW